MHPVLPLTRVTHTGFAHWGGLVSHNKWLVLHNEGSVLTGGGVNVTYYGVIFVIAPRQLAYRGAGFD